MMMREECCALFFENFNSVVELFLLFLLFLLRRGVEKGATNARPTVLLVRHVRRRVVLAKIKKINRLMM